MVQTVKYLIRNQTAIQRLAYEVKIFLQYHSTIRVLCLERMQYPNDASLEGLRSCPPVVIQLICIIRAVRNHGWPITFKPPFIFKVCQNRKRLITLSKTRDQRTKIISHSQSDNKIWASEHQSPHSESFELNRCRHRSGHSRCVDRDIHTCGNNPLPIASGTGIKTCASHERRTQWIPVINRSLHSGLR